MSQSPEAFCLVILGGIGSNNGQFDIPSQLTTDPIDRVFIPDTNNHIFIPDTINRGCTIFPRHGYTEHGAP